jgi:hypothetical protein
MLQRAGVENAAQLVEAGSLEKILPQVTEAAHTARRMGDKDRTRRDALDMAARLMA